MTPRACGLLLLLPVLLAGTAPAQAAGTEQASGAGTPRIRIHCASERMLLGEDGETELRIELDAEATELQVLASRGEVGPVRRVAPGVFRATYVPPPQRYPQVAILAAVAQGPRGVMDGWTVLPLWGQGVAEVHTRAGKPVSLSVGEKRYGPLPADAQGVARIAVEVPPGVHEAWFEGRRIDLGVPPLPLAQALAERRQLQADREELVGVRIYTVTPEGKPQRRVGFSLEAPSGRVAVPQEVEPGVYVAQWTVPPGRAGPLELTGGVRGDPRGAFSVRVERVPGPARRFEMKVDRSEVVAAEEARVGVEVSAWDGMGNPARASLQLVSSLGDKVTLTERQPGRYAAALGVVPAFGGQRRLELRLFAEGGAEPVLTQGVGLRASEPARVEVQPLQAAFVGDGQREATWRIAVADRFGNPVPAPAPVVVHTGGRPAAPREREPGVYEVRFVPPATSMDQQEELEARVGEARGRGHLTLLHHRPLLAASARAGLVTNLADVVALSVGAQVEAWPGLLLRDLGLLLDVSSLRFTRAGGSLSPDFEGQNALFAATPALALRGRVWSQVDVWGAVGPSAAWVQSRTRLGAGPVLEEGAWVLGAQAWVGAGLRLGPGSPFLEARYCWFDDPSLLALRGSLRGGGFHLGYRLELL
jgi:hypothetical protein